jgi:hypothetical protein
MIPKYVNIKEDSTLVRDTFSMGVLNVNTPALEATKRRKQQALKKLAEDRHKEAELNTLCKDVADLKKLVQELLEREK